MLANRLIELANCGFGMSTDAFLKSVKKFLDKEVRIITFLKQPLAFPAIPQSFVMFYFTMLGYIFGPAVRILGNIGALQKY